MISNAKRVYALAGSSVEVNHRSNFFLKTQAVDNWHGPCSSVTSVCLMIARQLARESRSGMSLISSRSSANRGAQSFPGPILLLADEAQHVETRYAACFPAHMTLPCVQNAARYSGLTDGTSLITLARVR
jgi:hypothetical protein